MMNPSGADDRPSMCIVDRPGWADDRKTDALARVLVDQYRIVKRYQAEVSEPDLMSADLVMLYYWLQFGRLGGLRESLRQHSKCVAIGICSRFELEDDWRSPGLELLTVVDARTRTPLEAYVTFADASGGFTPARAQRASDGTLIVTLKPGRYIVTATVGGFGMARVPFEAPGAIDIAVSSVP